MIVDLLSVTDEPVPFNFRISADKLDLETTGVRIVGDIDIVGDVRKNAAKTDVTGSIKAPLEIDCTRCLAPVKSEFDIAFQVDYVGKEMFPEGKETHLGSADLDTDVIEGSELDLSQVAREQIVLNLPEQVLCRDDCKGICARCGKDLNEGDCRCGQDDIDPRWAALKSLKR